MNRNPHQAATLVPKTKLQGKGFIEERQGPKLCITGPKPKDVLNPAPCGLWFVSARLHRLAVAGAQGCLSFRGSRLRFDVP